MGAAKTRKKNGTYPTITAQVMRVAPPAPPTVKFRFDMSRVPLKERNNETVREMVWEYTNNLQDRKWKRALCIHEASHAIFAEMFGNATQFHTDFYFSYDNPTDSFTFTQAGVIHEASDYSEAIAVALAGPVGEMVVAGTTSKDNFIVDYEQVHDILTMCGVPESGHRSYIKNVERQIRIQLRDEELRNAILQRADEYEHILEDHISQMVVRVAA